MPAVPENPPCDTCDSGVNIFSAAPGSVVLLPGDAVPATFTVDNSSSVFHNLNAIVTGVSIRNQGGYQFMHALREFIYVYVFTERMGEISISGLAFPHVCSDLGPNASGQDPDCVFGTSGLVRVQTWYECNRITTRAAPIRIGFGDGLIYSAFLTNLDINWSDPSTGIAQFTMRLYFVPNTTAADEYCFSLEESCLDAPCGDGNGLLGWDA